MCKLFKYVCRQYSNRLQVILMRHVLYVLENFYEYIKHLKKKKL